MAPPTRMIRVTICTEIFLDEINQLVSLTAREKLGTDEKLMICLSESMSVYLFA